MVDETTPRIYVACLAAYNAGKLHGAWIEVDADSSVMEEAIETMLAASPIPNAEEWAIHDYRYTGKLSENANLDSLAEVFEVAETNNVSMELVGEADTMGVEPHNFEDAHLGETTLRDYSDNQVDDLLSEREVPDFLAVYFDYEKFFRDFEIETELFEIDGHLFDPNR